MFGTDKAISLDIESWCEAEKRRLQRQLECMETGVVQTRSQHGDTTVATILQSRKHLAELDRLVADHSARRLVARVLG